MNFGSEKQILIIRLNWLSLPQSIGLKIYRIVVLVLEETMSERYQHLIEKYTEARYVLMLYCMLNTFVVRYIDVVYVFY
jgi:hypothetical protein